MKESLYIVDVFAYLFKFYFGYPSMRNPEGVPANGVYGMCKMLLNLLSQSRVTHAVAALDTPRENGFRRKIYSDYKCGRKQMPEELRQQMPLLREALDCFSLPVFLKEGFEADDIMATFASKVKSMPVVLIGSDKDLTQLVSGNVSLFDPVKGVFLDEQGVIDKMGVSPCLVPDLQGLCGDSSDNIPGVPGVGPKTAVKLISQEGTLEEILMEAACSCNTPALQKILEHEDIARISKDLATLRKDVPIEWTIDDLKRGDCGQRLRDFFQRNSFHSLMRHLKDL